MLLLVELAQAAKVSAPSHATTHARCITSCRLRGKSGRGILPILSSISHPRLSRTTSFRSVMQLRVLHT